MKVTGRLFEGQWPATDLSEQPYSRTGQPPENPIFIENSSTDVRQKKKLNITALL